MDFKFILSDLHNHGFCKNTTLESAKEVDAIYPVKISEHIKREIITNHSSGIFNQFIPNPEEIEDDDGAGAFFDDEKHLTNMVVQKYPNRCIIYATSRCFANCRHCSRKAKWNDAQQYSRLEFDNAYLALLQHPNIEEVIITGGDALTIPTQDIDYMLKQLCDIKHIKTIRIGTRAFTSNPYVFTDELCEIFTKYRSIVISTQFNHPDEFTQKTEDAIAKVQKTGIPILNQSTLLKGINDDYDTMKQLLTKCAANRVIPYYLFHCFKVKGVQCFRTDVHVGIDIINKLVGNVGGWWIPRYTLIPHTTGVKVPVHPNGIIIDNPVNTVLKDFRGREVLYE